LTGIVRGIGVFGEGVREERKEERKEEKRKKQSEGAS
jgi:hypothetical protein